MILTLAEIKVHLRLPPETDETVDAELAMMEAAAVDYAEQFLGRTMPWDSNPVPASVRAALLLIIGDLYENREAQIVGVARADNPTVSRLLNLYRTGLGV